jgi:hypothetical protein
MASSFDMDQLTLQCFTDKKTYSKYLAKKDPVTFHKNESFHQELRENREAILEFLSHCILHPNSMSHNVKMQDAFNQLMIECIDVVKKVADEEQQIVNDKEEGDEVLFSKCKDLGIQPTNTIEYWKMQTVFKQ